MNADSSAEILDWWIEAALSGGDWRAPLDLTARALDAAGIAMICRDHATKAITASVGSNASIDFVLRCRELARRRWSEQQQVYALHLGYINWASADTGAEGRRKTVSLFALHDRRADEAAMAPAATIAACSVSARARIDASQAQLALKRDAAEQLPVAVAIVDERMRVAQMNDACRSMLARVDGLSLADGRLHCAARGDQAALARAVSAALDGHSVAPVVRVVRNGDAEPYVVRAICASEGPGAQCLLMIVDPAAGPPLANDPWRAMFDLTEAELEAASNIVAGATGRATGQRFR